MAGSIDIASPLQAAQAWFVERARDLWPLAGLESYGDTHALPLAAGAAGLLLSALWFVLRGARRSSSPSHGDLAMLMRGPRRLGLVAAGVFAAALVGWSVLAPLASAALAPGVISPDGYRKTVQHLEGGIIRTIHVREGDTVAAGDPLITLDDTAARSLDAEIRERFLHVLATEARLEAERVEAGDITFPQALQEASSDELRQVMEGQRQLFQSRRATQSGRAQILEARVLQLGEQNAGLEQVIDAQEEQLSLIDEEIDTAQVLLDQGLERRPRVLALRRVRADIAATHASNRAKIAENAEAIGEAQLQLLAIDEERREAIASELADIRRVLAELRGQLPSRVDILERTVIRSPISGVVMNLRATTEGGVIRPGDPLLDIVPDGAQLIINARVQPTDVERVAPGMPARVVLTAYRQRNMPLVLGRLQSISADTLVDDRTGLSYFLARVEVDQEDLAALSHVQLMPGMPAEVMLLDGEQSLLGYLLAPILESRRRSFSEK
jgi:HlyD family type I secretion membrane fusion protein